ncbi:MAG TPA: outer membrane lipoprotein chaperone LolA [Thiobacillaceae bacterium]|nr:outer membrane lipoprotein chaperone LolA [Thiobacillaceae bacterium]
MNRLLAALALGLGLLTALPAQADAIQRLREYVQETKTLRGSFEQTVQDRKGRKAQESRGSFQFSRPGKFRWVYDKPYEQLIVGDGEKIWIHDKDLEQVTVKKMGKAIGQSPAALLAGSNEIDKHYDLRDLGSKKGLEWLEAIPKDKESSFEKVRLGFKGSQLEAMELSDNFGQLTTLRFSGLIRNPGLGADLFRFTPPKGTDVIGDD